MSLTTSVCSYMLKETLNQAISLDSLLQALYNNVLWHTAVNVGDMQLCSALLQYWQRSYYRRVISVKTFEGSICTYWRQIYKKRHILFYM